MSGYPLGAKDDSSAPYNTDEKVFKFDIVIKGIVYYEYNGILNIDDAIEQLKEQLEDRVYTGLNCCGDLDLIDVDVELE